MKLSNGEILMAWPVADHRITAGWTYSDGSAHNAIDLGVTNVPFGAALSGKVTRVYTWNGKKTSGDTNSYGNFIDIEHESYNGMTLKTRYAHLSEINVSVGQTVEEGEICGVTGSTGNVTGPHLHFEVILDGERVNPLNWLDNDFYKAYDYVVLGSYTSVQRPSESNTSSVSDAKKTLQRICIIGASGSIKQKANDLGLKTQDVTATIFDPASDGDAMTLWSMAQQENSMYFSSYTEV